MKEVENYSGMHAGAKPVIFKRAQALRANMTEPKKVVWEYLKKHPLGFRRQHPFNNYVLDFYCHREKISIEIDGESHSALDQKEHDEVRTEFIKGLGIKEVRFKNEHILNQFEYVLKQIEELLRADSLQGKKGRGKEQIK